MPPFDFSDHSKVDNEKIRDFFKLIEVELKNGLLSPKLISIHLTTANKFCLQDDISQVDFEVCSKLKLFLGELMEQCQNAADNSTNHEIETISSIPNDDETLDEDDDINNQCDVLAINPSIYAVNERAKAKFTNCFDAEGNFLVHLFSFSIDSEDDEWLSKPTDVFTPENVIQNLQYFSKKLFAKLSFVYPFEVGNQTLQSFVVAFLTKYPQIEEAYQQLKPAGKHTNACVSIFLILFN